MAVGRDPRKANAALRRDASLRVLRKVRRYLERLGKASRMGDAEEIVRLMNFATPHEEMVDELIDILDGGDDQDDDERGGAGTA